MRLLALPSLLAAFACGQALAQVRGAPLRLAPSKLEPVDVLQLGRTSAEQPADVRDALLIGRRWIVLDAQARRLMMYDSRTGVLLAVAGRWGADDGTFDLPRRLHAAGDTIWVLDVTHRNAISAFDTTGRFLGSIAPSLAKFGPTGLAVGASGNIAVATLTGTDTTAGRATTLIVTRSGGRIAATCPESPVYERSRRLKGQLQGYGFRDVAAHGSKFLCIEPVSPRIVVVDSVGNRLAVIDTVAAFYRPPIDELETPKLTRDRIRAFQAKWTAHERVFATSWGFASVYSQGTDSQPRYRLFWCQLAPTGRASGCKDTETVGRPLRMLSGDRLLVAESSSGRTRLVTYRLSRR